MVNRKIYGVEETARFLEISKQTLIRYEKKGVFPKPHRNPINKWREYSLDDVNRMKKVLGRRI